MVCGAHLRLLAPWATWLFSQLMWHWWRVNGSTASQPFPCTHQSTPSTRLDWPQEPFFKSSVWPDRESNPTNQLRWCGLNQLYHLSVKYFFKCLQHTSFTTLYNIPVTLFGESGPSCSRRRCKHCKEPKTNGWNTSNEGWSAIIFVPQGHSGLPTGIALLFHTIILFLWA